MKTYQRSIAAALLLCSSIVAVTAEDVSLVMRVSVENSASHVQVRMLKRFAERVNDARLDALRIEVFDSARLFRDADVVSALSLGKVEMAVPGIWQLDRYVPDFAALMLPSVYGADESKIAAVVDGGFGSYLTKSLADVLPVIILGRWMELGGSHAFFIGKNPRGFSALRVRVAGGAANEERVRALGGVPMTIPWPDLPQFLSRGTVDAVVTTYETVVAGTLFDSGIGSVLEETHYVGYYVPMVNRRFWERLDDRTRSVLSAAWERTVDEARLEARKAQSAAKQSLIGRGLVVHIATASETESRRKTLLPLEPSIAERVHVSNTALELLHSTLSRQQK